MSKVTNLKDRKCSICDGHIEPLRNDKGDVVWEGGNCFKIIASLEFLKFTKLLVNAQPINDGRCCSECNSTVVLAARLEAMGV
tara:strand:+ start:1420 stop:1668 length:249 start_codon:yes stop_codon:yes gene_type:complete